MEILGLTKTTLLDYPEHVAATIFTGGCNLRCPFCHNRDLVFPEEGISSGRTKYYSEEEILSFLQKRKHILSGICITGGEPTLQADLVNFIQKVKALGLHVKLDTNGFRPDILRFLIHEQFIDYVAVDIKNSPQKYAQTSGLSTCYLELIQETVDLLLHQSENLPYEFRTTVVKELHSQEDMHMIGKWLQNAKAYYLQPFVASSHMITDNYSCHDETTLHNYLDICRQYIPNTHLRGME